METAAAFLFGIVFATIAMFCAFEDKIYTKVIEPMMLLVLGWAIILLIEAIARLLLGV